MAKDFQITWKLSEGDPPPPAKSIIIFWRVGPLWYRLPLLGECSRNPPVSVYQLVVLWEAVFCFCECFLRLFQSACLFHDRWFASAPAHTALSVHQFLTKNCMTPMPHPPYSPNHTLSDFFFVFEHMKKVLKGKRFADVKEVRKKVQKH